MHGLSTLTLEYYTLVKNMCMRWDSKIQKIKKTEISVDGTPSQIPVFDLTKSSAMFEVATSYSLGGDAFTRKNIISLLTLTLDHETLPSILYII